MAACVINHLVMFFGILLRSAIKHFSESLDIKLGEAFQCVLNQERNTDPELICKHLSIQYLPSVWIMVWVVDRDRKGGKSKRRTRT